MFGKHILCAGCYAARVSYITHSDPLICPIDENRPSLPHSQGNWSLDSVGHCPIVTQMGIRDVEI